ncbi:helix-turn-helix domain-containing protein [Saccharopolyspora griseoalba]|uniref:Helix-turn-helix domain-containing protein n=1 Tax=Saccharopolyspora griseoalba TaxID=1431848 RepID=A0ABW2LK32_9PSEU
MATTPTVRRLLLSNELKRLRSGAGVGPERAAQHLGCRVSKISRIELAQNSIQAGDVKLLSDLYGVDPERTEVLLDLARGQNQRARWSGYRSTFPDWFRMFVDLERDAAAIRSVEVEIIPGLLQTEDYIRAIHEEEPSGTDELDDPVHARQERQSVLGRTDPPDVSFILSESCLRRIVGSSEVMRDQLDHLVEVSRLPNVQLQVLPFDAKTFAGRIIFRFTMLNIPAQGVAPLDFVYVESFDDARYLEDNDAIATYSRLWGRLQAAALCPVESRDFIAKVAADLG